METTEQVAPGGGGVMADKETRVETTSTEKKYDKNLTVNTDILAEEEMMVELMQTVRQLCGGLMGCRKLGSNRYEMTLSSMVGKQRIMEGFKIGLTTVEVTDISRNEVMVSFLRLPVYTMDKEIYDKLLLWGVTPVSPIKRRMWPGTNVADGTRFV